MPEGEQDRPPLPRRKLRVTSYDQIGKTKKNAPIFKVTAVKEDGSPVDLELRAFQELPVGEVIEFGMKKYVHPTHGETWTLYPPKEKLGRRVDALESQVEDLSRRIEELETGNLGGGSVAADDNSAL